MLLSSKTLHLAGTRKLWARFVGPFRCWSVLGRLPTGWISGEDSKMFTMSSMSQLRKHTPGGSSANPPEPLQMEGEVHFKV